LQSIVQPGETECKSDGVIRHGELDIEDSEIKNSQVSTPGENVEIASGEIMKAVIEPTFRRQQLDWPIRRVRNGELQRYAARYIGLWLGFPQIGAKCGIEKRDYRIIRHKGSVGRWLDPSVWAASKTNFAVCYSSPAHKYIERVCNEFCDRVDEFLNLDFFPGEDFELPSFKLNNPNGGDPTGCATSCTFA
jgi:hypothetical protein